jgi:REP element-mobilizing transposase RayT
MNGIFRRRKLPHWDVDGHPIFITACLDGSISASGLQQIRDLRAELEIRPKPPEMTDDGWEHHKHKLLFGLVDKLLDGHSPVTHLADDRQAEIVQNAFLHFANERYQLLAFVVMPSHHHWLFVPNESWGVEAVRRSRESDGGSRTPREIISHSIQSYTATMCNRVQGKTGAYWQTETFDHWARNEAEMLRIIDYIEQNPVKAGLVKHAEDWRWSSARLRAETGIARGIGLQPVKKIPRF